MRNHPMLRWLSIIASVGCILGTQPEARTEDYRPPIVSEGQLTLIHDINIPTLVEGRVQAIHVREGDMVNVDDVLMQLDDALALADREATQWDARIAEIQRGNDIDLRYARMVLGVQEKELARSTAANERFPNSVSLTELSRLGLVVEQSRLAIEKAARDLEIAEATAAQKQAVARTAHVRWLRHTVRAPEAGMIVEIMPTAGEWLAAGQTVVRVLRTDPLRVESFIDGHSQTADLVGHSLTFTPHLAQGAAAKSFVGTVVFVSPEIHPLTGQIRIRGEIPNPDGWLRPGMNGTLNIALERPDVQP